MTLSDQPREVINSPESPASDDVLVDALLGFANGERLVMRPEPDEAVEDPNRQHFATLLQGIARTRERFKQTSEGKMWVQTETLYSADEPWIPEESARLRGSTDVLQELRIGRRNFLGYAYDLLRVIQVKPVLVFGSHGCSIQHFNDFPNLEGMLTYAVLLLLDGTKPYGAALSQCRLATCRRFYLARKKKGGGRANRTYCCPEHLEEHHNSAERKAATSKRAQERASRADRARARKHK